MTDSIKLSDSEFKLIAIQKGYEPVIHGQWQFLFKDGRRVEYGCSKCTRIIGVPAVIADKVAKVYPYCHCGAKMDINPLLDRIDKVLIGDE